MRGRHRPRSEQSSGLAATTDVMPALRSSRRIVEATRSTFRTAQASSRIDSRHPARIGEGGELMRPARSARARSSIPERERIERGVEAEPDDLVHRRSRPGVDGDPAADRQHQRSAAGTRARRAGQTRAVPSFGAIDARAQREVGEHVGIMYSRLCGILTAFFVLRGPRVRGSGFAGSRRGLKLPPTKISRHLEATGFWITIRRADQPPAEPANPRPRTREPRTVESDQSAIMQIINPDRVHPSSSSAAARPAGWRLELTRQGIDVLLLDAGAKFDPPRSGPTSNPGRARERGRAARSRRSSSGHHETAYLTPDGRPFALTRVWGHGGKTNVWGRVSLRYSQMDLKASDGMAGRSPGRSTTRSSRPTTTRSSS